LQAEELLLLLLGDAGEQFAASLGRDVPARRVPVQAAPVPKPEQRIVFLKNEEVCDGEYRLEVVWKARAQVVNYSDLFADHIQQVGRTVKLPVHGQRRDTTTLNLERLPILGGLLSASSVRGDYLACFLVHPADKPAG